MREVKMTPADVATRRDHAHAFLTAADLIETLGADSGIEHTTNLVGSLAVLSGIAASDTITGHVLGIRSASENHADALRMLKRSSRREEQFASHLKRLLDAKSDSQYSALFLTPARARALLTTARRLVNAMDDRLRLRT